jgi:hypothetical protein
MAAMYFHSQEIIMKSGFLFAITILAAFILTGCSTDAATRHKSHSDSMASQEGMGMMGKKMRMSDAEMQSMCDMHMQMMHAQTPEQRKAMMAEHIKSMSPQMMQEHMNMMQSEMQMMREQMGTQAPAK